MSNTIGYSIPSCSKGERFDFSKSLGNDATGNITTYRIGGVRVNALIDLPTAWWPLTELPLEPANTAYGNPLYFPSSILHNREGRTSWHERSASVEDFNLDQIYRQSDPTQNIGSITPDGVTWMAWVNGFINDDFRYIFSKMNGYPEQPAKYEYYLETHGGGWGCYANVDGGHGFIYGSGNSNIGSGWHLITFRITSERISVWVDGQKNAEGPMFSGAIAPADPTILMKVFGWIDGDYGNTYKFQCKGRFQDLMWFNKGVSDETIEWFYNNGAGRIPPELVNFTPGCTVS